MTPYTIYNAVLALFVLSASYWMLARSGRLDGLRIAARIALLVAFIGYPWDFFAIQLGVWEYPKAPGPKLYGVPLNDLFFMAICTFLTVSVLIAVSGREARRDRHAERKDARE